jgi:NADH:ubiquinone oxidoreductase subunit K
MSAVVVAAALFAIGLYGVLTRRDIVGLLASVEVMLGGALVLLVALGASDENTARVEGIALVLLVVAAAEAAVGLALLVAVARRSRTTRIDELTEVRG